MNKCTCIKCLYSKTIPVTTDLLCKYAGVVTYDYSCKRFVSSPCGDKRLKYCRCDSCAYFSPEKDQENLGHCKLFGLKNMEGYNKKGCGKYKSRYSQDNTYES